MAHLKLVALSVILAFLLSCSVIQTTAAQEAALVDTVGVVVACCSQCGMTTFGYIATKICGPNGCCYTSHLGNVFDDCGAYTFGGAGIGDCDGFDIGPIDDSNVQVGLYHGGTDGAQIDSIKFQVVNPNNTAVVQTAECFFENVFLDGTSFIVSEPGDCIVF
ncbi:hypothetical protein TCAL_05119 [Tigriopus californicus]|uniref:Uncharacterized protein n=1 Tax=Tigriopus californicus TaxID=6832 RepID=A0A553PNT9_TIGCA|nr:uncharacterized protein LOC131882798 [Tigriopus californicus]TRY79342.1 hypothetical protein TCAL_05119 [Tigriopus californicus]|eukprot:TCALIF_05119-PA protein Name:"Protein of unknown function" AED:0.00 eAED:0.00 QI:11/1/1/1/1/1/3/4/161